MSRRRRFQLRGHRLRQYVWDARVARTTCRACALGTGQILARTWRWVMGAGSWDDRAWRATAPAGTVAAAVWVVAHYPVVAPSAVALAWLVAAGVLAPRDAWTLPPVVAEETQREGATEPPAEDVSADPRAALLDLLDRLTRGRNGVHFSELYEHPELAGLREGQLGPLLDHAGVPWVRSLSVAGVAGRSGVRRADVEALLAALPQEGPAATLSPTLARVDLRKSQPLSPDSQPTLAAVSAAGAPE